MLPATYLAGLPLETLKSIADYLPVISILRLASSRSSLRRILGICSIWETLDFTGAGDRLTDEEYIRFLHRLEEWTTGGIRNSDSQRDCLTTIEIRELIFDSAAITWRTVRQALFLPTLVKLSIRDCKNVDMSELFYSGFNLKWSEQELPPEERQLKRLDFRGVHRDNDLDSIRATHRGIKQVFPGIHSVKPAICTNGSKICWDCNPDGDEIIDEEDVVDEDGLDEEGLDEEGLDEDEFRTRE
ncbi:hypothetical protein HDU93_006238 [Gonapodya sp. JEL0774]|nr:hypothetical protein HDU93_006238 [Gonapodya sp. JEL0774]